MPHNLLETVILFSFFLSFFFLHRKNIQFLRGRYRAGHRHAPTYRQTTTESSPQPLQESCRETGNQAVEIRRSSLSHRSTNWYVHCNEFEYVFFCKMNQNILKESITFYLIKNIDHLGFLKTFSFRKSPS